MLERSIASRLNRVSSMQTKQLILLGPPGIGVEAQATVLAERWHVPAVSMEQLLQAAMAAGSPLSTEVQSYRDAHQLVPDALMMKLIRKRFEQPDVVLKGWVLDGFPRTLAQAQAFDEWWSVIGQSTVTVVYLKAMTGVLINRLWTENPNNEPLSAIRRRLEQHQEEVAPILAYYRQRSQLTTLNGSLSFAEVASELAQMGLEETGATPWIQNEAELNDLLTQKPRLVIDCMASWCGSCKQVTPLIDKLAEAYRDDVAVMKLDFDANRQVSKRFGLQGIPAVMFFQNGRLLETLTGIKSYQEYSAAVARLLESD